MTKCCMLLMGWVLLSCSGCAIATLLTELRGGDLTLKLGLDRAGIPVVKQAQWSADRHTVFEAADLADGMKAWLPADLLPTAPLAGDPSWRISDDPVFRRASASRDLPGNLRITWVVELAKRGSILRMHVELANRGDRPKAVEWFPGWTASWQVPEGVSSVRAWRSLSFAPAETRLGPDRRVELRSRLHSSDSKSGPGFNPYWIVHAKNAQLCFSLDWCGGWQASVTGKRNGLDFAVRLPPNETQLTLPPGAAIAGPIVTVTPIRQTDEALARADWMAQRVALGRDLYGGPQPVYPLTYNNWYTTRFGLTADFLRRQVAAMDPYKFDYFIVDAGWYGGMGQWTPAGAKFKPGEFETILQSVKDKGVGVGIWTCPQFVCAKKDALPPDVDVPGFYEKFIDGWLLDLVGCDYKKLLLDHVAMLRKRYHADWWKYDQVLFAAETRAGVMRNVHAFQDALLAVRKAQPDLVIENCQSGGRMINELTMLATQSQWLRDGGKNGLDHARDNISTVLNALAFVPPWAAGRWTNNFQEMDPDDDELTRLYCRSAMPGTWGIVSDLSEIPDRQRKVILQEVEHYRRLSEFKSTYRYALHPPGRRMPLTSIIFYGNDMNSAAALLFRWDGQGQLEHRLKLPLLQSKSQYEVTDVDLGSRQVLDAAQLRQTGLPVRFDPKHRSALLFIRRSD
ncbi:MAG: alpha-galactosidase [Phycisphaerae bacterium]|nr:alpha-galactosidase [Phycisphaerae bacterium]